MVIHVRLFELFLAQGRVTFADSAADRLAGFGQNEITAQSYTVVAFHGEELYEHNKYFYHSCSIYDSVLRIPLVFKFPGVLPENKVVASQVESIDIMPTILDLMKMPLRDDFEGRSLMPYLFGNGVEQWRQVFAERTASILATRTPQWKYIYNPDEYHPDCVSRRYSNGFPYYIAAEELYDIQNDPGETSNLAEQYPEIARDLRAQILQWVSTNKKTHEEIELTEEAKERLRALGYIK
ncbi:sulfatase-like hydrolase/transferase [candidate division KSB1 bacterium]|nr:sulfatase-like hydrolase/transferase [candidate division KSB1 bacterium]